MNHKLERILQRVQKPARYTGGEYGQVIKDISAVDVRIAFCFPDTYEIGMSNLGLRILYGVLNSMEGVWCERVFAPWEDMEIEMRRENQPLYALESGDPIGSFDIIAFSIGYELSYTNVLNMLDLTGIDPIARDRQEDAPIVIAGGTCCYNPEPLTDFIDLFVIGEGELVIHELLELFREQRIGDARQSKRDFLKAAASIEGVYVPSLYEVEYKGDGTVGRIVPQHEASLPVKKRIINNLDESYYPVETIVPSLGLVHDRVVLELFRGCIRGCRFCQAGHVGRPLRNRSSDVLINQGIKALNASGYDEIALLSLSTSDYEELFELCDGLMGYCEPRKINLSLPSLRADNFSVELMDRVQKIRRSGLTFAPEAGSQRLRDVINKNLTEDDLLETCKVAFKGGWNSVKLYFMLGLPTETDDDIIAIADAAHKVLRTWKEFAKSKSRGVRITISTSCFVPKPHTPFQWESQIGMIEYLRRVELLRSRLRSKAINYKWHSPDQGFIEAALARGDRRIGKVIETAWRSGARHDSWSECFLMQRWQEAFADCGIEPEFYASRERDTSEILPWSIISTGVMDSHFINERLAAYEGSVTLDCREGCSGCGACAAAAKL